MKAQDLDELARRVARLSPDRRDPEQFFVDRDEVAKTLRRLAREAAADRRAA